MSQPTKEQLKEKLKIKLQANKINRMNKVSKDAYVQKTCEKLGIDPEKLKNLNANNK
jgi:hypothetical protein